MIAPERTQIALRADGRTFVEHDRFARVDDSPTRDTALVVVGLSHAMLADTFRAFGAIDSNITVNDCDPLTSALRNKDAMVTAVLTDSTTVHGALMSHTDRELVILSATQPAQVVVVRREMISTLTVADAEVIAASYPFHVHITVEKDTPAVPVLRITYETASMTARIEHLINRQLATCQTWLVVENNTNTTFADVSLSYSERVSDQRDTANTVRAAAVADAMETTSPPPLLLSAARPPPHVRSQYTAVVERRLPVLRPGVTRVPLLGGERRLAEFVVMYVAEMRTLPSATDEEQCVVRRRAEWRMSLGQDFMFSGAVELVDSRTGRFWMDAWKSPTHAWVDLDQTDDVVVRRRIHQSTNVGAYVRQLVCVEVHNRSLFPAGVVVQERIQPGQNLAAAAKSYQYIGPSVTVAARHADVERAFRPDAVDRAMWCGQPNPHVGAHKDRATDVESPDVVDMSPVTVRPGELMLMTYEIMSVA